MSNNHRVIKWEHFEASLTPVDEANSIIDEALDDEDKNYFDTEFAEQEKFLDLSNKFDFTPFGPFLKKNPLSPYNLYKDNIWVANLYGFNAFDIPHLAEKLDATKGVAVWRQHDPHMIIFAFARSYDDSTEVKINIEMSILGHVQQKIDNGIVQDLLLYSKNKTSDHVISLLPNGKSEEVYENVDETVAELVELKKSITDMIIIRNGKEI